ncbi:MAG: hypothetical protein JNM78_00835 [Cyclobacteriaceae bacterium]|nr:hypothetical protein [Cyclobacteriaceae bacterium]
MEKERFIPKIGRIIKRFLLIALLLGIGTLCFLYWGVYEEGVWAGKVLSISAKGVLFKTQEGKISVESFGSLKGTSPFAETRDFSIENHEEQVIKDLQEVALKGERVSLHFIKRYVAFPWRGDTKYFITRVERSNSKE